MALARLAPFPRQKIEADSPDNNRVIPDLTNPLLALVIIYQGGKQTQNSPHVLCKCKCRGHLGDSCPLHSEQIIRN
jgi:hypothetical protein